MQRPALQAVELRHLTALTAVVREGSFRAAADRLGYAQSAISEQIAALEAIVGAQVMERRRGAAPGPLTTAGELLVRHADRILQGVAAADADLQALRDGRRGRLRIGVPESIGVRLMPAVLRELDHELPDVDVELTWGMTGNDLGDAVDGGLLDIAFGTPPARAADLETAKLVSDPAVLLVPARSPLAKRDRAPSAPELSALDLIRCKNDSHSKLADAALRAYGADPRYRLTAPSNAAVQALVAGGIGAAVVPRLAVDEEDDRIAVIPMDGVVPARAISLFWRSPARPTVRRVVEIAVRQQLRLGPTRPNRLVA